METTLQYIVSGRYKAGEDVGLDMHEDDSDVTLNVCLGKEMQPMHA